MEVIISALGRKFTYYRGQEQVVVNLRFIPIPSLKQIKASTLRSAINYLLILMHIYIWLCIHSSSACSLAELRFPGSHCSILRMNRKEASLSTLPSRVVSLSSSGARPVKLSGVRKPPTVTVVSGFELDENLVDYQRKRTLACLHLNRTYLLAPRGQGSPEMGSKKINHFSKMCSTWVRLEFRVVACKQGSTFVYIPNLEVNY